jgi:hypothetical protein
MTTTTKEPAPVALVWWSFSRAAWCCQIGNDRSFHYNERDAIAHGERLAAAVSLHSCIVGEWA